MGVQAAVALAVLVRAVRLHVLRADHVHVQRLQDQQVLVRRRLILHRGRDDLVELVVRDVAAVLLGPLLDLLDHGVALLGAQHAVGLEGRHRHHVLGVEVVRVAERRQRHHAVNAHRVVNVVRIRHVRVVRRLAVCQLRGLRDLLQVQVARLGLSLVVTARGIGRRLRVLVLRRGLVLVIRRHIVNARHFVKVTRTRRRAPRFPLLAGIPLNSDLRLGLLGRNLFLGRGCRALLHNFAFFLGVFLRGSLLCRLLQYRFFHVFLDGHDSSRL